MAARSTLTGIAVAAVFVSEAAIAQPRYRIITPAEELRSAVIRVGQQTGVSVGIRDQSLGAIRVRALFGTFTARQALERILIGTPATAVQIGDRTWVVVRRKVPVQRPRARRIFSQPPRTLPKVLPPPEQQTEIIVTGSKRGLTLRDYPGSVDLLLKKDIGELERASGTEALLSKLPALSSTHFGSGRNKLFIRGIADSSFNGATQATVGQYLGETRLNYNAPDPDLRLHDFRGVEVLKGAQGTLFGAGTIGGIVRLLPEPPRLDRPEASVAASAGNTARGGVSREASVIFNLPLLRDKLGLRAVAYTIRAAGYIDDIKRDREDVNRTSIRGGRISLRWQPTKDLQIDALALSQSTRGQDSQYTAGEMPLSRASSIAQPYANNYRLGSVTVQKNWGDLSLVSAFGGVKQRLVETYDATVPDQEPVRFRQSNDISLLSWETRLSRQHIEGADWMVGTSFLRSRSIIDRRFDNAAPTSRPMTGVGNGVDEATFFGEAGFKFYNRFTLTLGSRLTHASVIGRAQGSPLEYLSRNARMSAARSQTTVLPSAALAYQPNEAVSVYLRYQEGFRPGGLAVEGDLVRRFDSDDVTSAEAGFRYGQLKSRFYLAASGSYTRWRDIQADTVDGGGFPITSNIGDGDIYSLDAAMAWRAAPGLSLELGGVLNFSEVTDPAPSIIIVPSSTLPNVAKLSGRAAIDYSTGLSGGWDIDAGAWVRYVGKSRLGIGAVLGELQGNYVDTGTSLRLSRGPLAVSLAVSNLLDKVGNRFALGSPFTIVYGRQITPQRPRTVTLGFDWSF